MSHSPSAMLDAQLLLAHVLNVNRVWLLTWDDKIPTAQQQQEFEELLVARERGEPIAYLVGQREFWGRSFCCDASTLIPRPDTETLVETILSLTLPSSAQVLDMGTGTGCIAITLAAEQPAWQVLATDKSAASLMLAKYNAEQLAVANIRFQESDWYQSIQSECLFDVIVSNPPYIDPTSHHLSEGDVRFEPRSALTAEESGIADLKSVIEGATAYLKPDGWLWVEHGYDQAKEVCRLLKKAGFSRVKTHEDLGGNERCSGGCYGELVKHLI